MNRTLRNGARWVLNALLPRPCAHCGEDLHYLSGDPLCPDCLSGLSRISPPYCASCGLPLPDGGGSCRDCRGRGRSLSAARAAFVFEGGLRSLVHAFKYRGRDDLAAWLAARMAEAMEDFPELAEHAFCVPVPLSPSRMKERGFNQSGLLSRELAARRNLFHLDSAAARVRATRSQADLSRAERLGNMREAFSVPDPRLVRDRKILLVDDVATTLATLDSLAAELKKAGAASVAAFTLAREP